MDGVFVSPYNLDMKLMPEQIQKLAQMLFLELSQNKMIEVISSESAVRAKIASIIQKDADLEAQIEKQAKDMMTAYQQKVTSGEIDYQKMYTMIKKQIMKDKGFTP